ncbi:GGDEF domain-containing protein [Listeria floridensis]|uniref:GGDEF domain-containing protein n=1 Tax=Listeria floridensis TaxID=1494962 RepID=UPI00138AF839|nr:GGDEF domain-containing protein [Listeria floridensis]
MRFTLSMDAAAIFGLLSLLVFAFISSLFIPFLKRKWSDKLNLIILNLFSLLLSSVNLLVFQDLTQFAIVIILLTTFFSFLTLFFVSYVIHDMERSRLARLEEKELAYTDFLTGLANVRSFNQLFHQFTHAENPPSLNLLILDIDFFKNVNDTYGHSVGDKVLQDIAHVLRKNAPNYDYLFRVGGEEFCLLLPKITLEEASETAEKIREAVENLLIDIGSEQPISVTISAGLASSELHPNEYLKLYQMADKALYSAKKSGRNRVAVY